MVDGWVSGRSVGVQIDRWLDVWIDEYIENDKAGDRGCNDSGLGGSKELFS